MLVSERDSEMDAIDGAVRAMYEVISGPAGAPRKWQRQHELFAPNARFLITHRENDGVTAIETMSLDEYQASRDAYLVANGFFETQVEREIRVRGDIAHAFSAFEGRTIADGPVFVRGWNSIQLVRSLDRWWAVSILWETTKAASSLRSPASVRLQR